MQSYSSTLRYSIMPRHLGSWKLEADPDYADAITGLGFTYYEEWAQLWTQDPGVLDRMSAAFHLRSTPEQATLEKLTVSLDDTKLVGQAKVLHAAQPGIRFDLQVDAIDLIIDSLVEP